MKNLDEREVCSEPQGNEWVPTERGAKAAHVVMIEEGGQCPWCLEEE
jgi:hypothetical protein